MPKDFESYINHSDRAKNVTLVTANKFSFVADMPKFAKTIEDASLEFKDYPYTSLPFIVTQHEDELPQRYFLRFSAEEIETSDAVFENLPATLEALTRIVQTTCIYLDNYEIPSHAIRAVNHDFKKVYSSFDTTSKRADDLTYLVKIILCAIKAIYNQSSMVKCAEDENKINKLVGGIFPIMLQDYMSVKQLENNHNKYYRYPAVMKDIYAFDIAAVKEYLDQHKIS